MNVTLLRRYFYEDCTIGELYVDGDDERVCWTLEDRARDGVKVSGQTAIPTGRYKIIVTPSQRFKTLLPLLLDVPGFTGVRIHAGNTAADTEGCIVVGQAVNGRALLRSRAACTPLIASIQTALDHQETVWITILKSSYPPSG